MKILKRLTCVLVASVAGTGLLAQDVVIGVPNWASVRGTAHILKFALEDNLGLDPSSAFLT